MKILPDDPRLTAYALGEIEDPDECIELEKALAADPELQAEVESIRSMCVLLRSGLEAEAVPELSEFEKAKLESAEGQKSERSLVRKIISWPVIVTTIAAVFVAMLMVPQVGSVRMDVSRTGERVNEEQATQVAAEGVRYRQLEVEIPEERLDGTPMPIKVPNLEPAPIEEPRILVATDSLGSSTARAQDESLSAASALADLSEVASVNVETAVGNHRPFSKMSVAQARSASVPTAPPVDYYAPPAQPISSQVEVKQREWNTEDYDLIEETGFRSPLVAPLSTFSIDVDTASYANVRRFLSEGQLPPADAVRVEELVNYFPYMDAAPSKSLEEGGAPFAVHMSHASAPWNESHQLLRIALKGYEMPWEERPASNLVFLLDVSGSMNQPKKLPLLKDAMQRLVRRLDERDRVAIVVYAGASGLVLPSTTANNTETIEHALKQLKAGGSTNAGAGIELAYKTAHEHFIEGGNNRVILCTDGDFNVGQTNRGELSEIVAKEAEAGVSLTILGFGIGNLKDGMLETLSNKGKGSYAYIDSEAEARKVFLQELASNIFKIAKDVKIQVEFNPAHVGAYRLIGYENRRLKAEDFNNDAKKAGDIGPGHSVVAFYEIVPAEVADDLPEVDPLRYQEQPEPISKEGELATVKLRYKLPEADESELITVAVDQADLLKLEDAPEDFRFGASVAGFGLLLRGSDGLSEKFGYSEVEHLAAGALGMDPGGHRSEFIGLVGKAEALTGSSEASE